MSVRVHLVGDRTLDNLYPFIDGNLHRVKEAKQENVAAQIAQKLPGSIVMNHAYEGFSTENILQGGDIGMGRRTNDGLSSGGLVSNTYIWIRLGEPKEVAELDYKINIGDLVMKPPYKFNTFVKPLEKLAEKVNEHPQDTHYVILSAGGTDFTYNPLWLLTNMSYVQKQYSQILQKIRQLPNIRPILMLQYCFPYNNNRWKMRGIRMYTVLGVLGTLFAAVQGISLAILSRAGLLFLQGRNPSKAFLALAALALYTTTRIIPWKATLGMIKGQNPAVATLRALLEKFYRPLLTQAKDLPVLDLLHSLDPCAPIPTPLDYEHFYTWTYFSDDVLSRSGGSTVAGWLAQIIQNHDFTKSGKTYLSEDKVTLKAHSS